MTGVAPARTGGEILVANLVAQGATHAFCVPGESFLAVLDALHDVRDRLRLIATLRRPPTRSTRRGRRRGRWPARSTCGR